MLSGDPILIGKGETQQVLRLPVANRPDFGFQSRDRKSSLTSSSFSSTFPVRPSQIRMASICAVASFVPSGLHRTALTRPDSGRDCQTNPPVFASQILTLEFHPTVASRVPSKFQSIEKVGP